MLHSPQGELVLASYPDPQIRLALHRLNADETDPGRRVNINDKLAELRAMRDRGWTIDAPANPKQRGTVSILLPRKKGGDRLTLSIIADGHTLAQRSEEFLRILLAERDRIFASAPAKTSSYPIASANDVAPVAGEEPGRPPLAAIEAR